jgi:hypothetical protein
MTTNTATSLVTRFEHDYDEWDDHPAFNWRKSYCCGLLEVHGLQSMDTLDGTEFGEPDVEDWERHVIAHLANKLFNKERFGQVYFTAVLESEDSDEPCGACDGEAGDYDCYDDEWIECDTCDGRGYLECEVYPVFDVLENELRASGVPACDITRVKPFINPNTGNKCQMMVLTITDETRTAMRLVLNNTDYTSEFSHK